MTLLAQPAFPSLISSRRYMLPWGAIVAVVKRSLLSNCAAAASSAWMSVTKPPLSMKGLDLQCNGHQCLLQALGEDFACRKPRASAALTHKSCILHAALKVNMGSSCGLLSRSLKPFFCFCFCKIHQAGMKHDERPQRQRAEYQRINNYSLDRL